MPVALIPIVIGVAEAAAGYAAFSVAAGFVLENVLAGAAMVGGAMTAVGAATGDKDLTKIGAIAGTIGTAGLAIENLAGASVTATQSMGPDTLSSAPSNLGQTGPTAAQDAAVSGSTISQAAGNNSATNIAQAATDQANVTPAQQSLIDANTNSPSDLPGTSNPTQLPTDSVPGASPSGATDPNAPQPGGAPTPDTGGGGAKAFGVSNTDNVNANAFNGGSTDSPWEAITKAVARAWDKDPAAVMKTGAGMVQGLASYVAPSPLERAQINEKNAAMKRLQWEMQQRANLNNSIRSMTGGGPSAAPGSAYTSTGFAPAPVTGAPPSLMPNPAPVTGAMQVPGLLQGAMYGS